MCLIDLHYQYPDLYKQLEEVAHKLTRPFCYLCYVDAPSGRCVRCGTDDLMRHLPGVGVEYGYEWVIKHLIDQNIDDIDENDQEEYFRDFIDSCYGDEVHVGFLCVNTGHAVQKLDPMTFDINLRDYFMEDAHIEIDGKLYCVPAIEQWVEEQLTLLKEAEIDAQKIPKKVIA
jgi:hypothetical protein